MRIGRQRKVLWVATALVMLALGVALAGCGGQEQPAGSQATPPQGASGTGAETQTPAGKTVNINFGTTSSGSSAYAYMTATAKSINDAVPGVRVTPIESGASVDNLQRIAKGEFDIGNSGHTVLYEALKGIGQFQDQANPDLRILWTYSIMPLTMVVREDSGITSLEGLEGKQFSSGGRGSSTEQMIAQAFDIIGVHPKYYLGSFDDAAQALADKQIVGLAKNSASMTAPDSLITQVQASTKLRFLSLTPEQADKIKQELPYFLFGTIKAGVYPDQNEDTLSTVQAAMIVGTNKISQEMGYQMAKAVFEDKDRQAAAFPAVKDTDYPTLTIDTAVVPLHAGTVKLLKELGKTVPADAVPAEYQE